VIGRGLHADGNGNILLAICLFVFMFSLGSGIASPIIPLYSSGLGASYIQIGIIGTAYGLVYAICAIPLGRMSDKLGRKVIMLLGAALCMFAAASYSMATNVNHIMFIRAIEGLAWSAFWPSIEALTTDLSHVSAVGRTMGLSTASYGAGFALGSLLAGTLASLFGYRYTFLFYLASAILATVLGLTMVHEPKKVVLHQLNSSRKASKSIGLRHRANILADLISMVYSAVLMTILTLLPVYAESLGIEVFSIGVLMMMLWVARITSFLNAGRISDKIGRKLVLTPSLAGLAIGSFLLAISETWWTLVFAVIVIGLSLGALFPVSIALISDYVSLSQRGMAMGMFETASALGQTIGPAVGGVLAEQFDPAYPYLFCMIASVACTFVVGSFLRSASKSNACGSVSLDRFSQPG